MPRNYWIGTPSRGRTAFDHSPRIREILDAEAPPDIPRIYLQGDICRENLLTEIDGIVTCESTTA